MPREYPSQPVVAVAAVIVKDGKMLLVKRANEPARGKWSLPGGVVELGESLRDALIREVREECGIDIEVDSLFDVVEVINKEGGRVRFHYVILDYLAHPIGGELRAMGDAEDVKWIPISEVEKYNITNSLRRLLKRRAHELF